MGQALYRKYRSKHLAEIVGQEHITTTLKNALDSKRISHAYLFTGPRGVGKTSVARILAHEVNNLPYSDDQEYLDIIEIDAASNRRIDEIRDLRDKVNLAPANAKYKVYIIDEVHMLTREAFNALLKTLEEPPEHVIFILATTEAYKLPETIVSRTQQYSFRPIPAGAMIGHLKDIAKSEKIKVDDESLNIIAEHGQGSFRDSISLLDQASSVDKQITVNELEKLLGMAPREVIENIIQAIANNSLSELLAQFEIINKNGYEITQLAKQLSVYLRNSLAGGGSVLSSTVSLRLMKRLIDVNSSNDPNMSFEIALMEEVSSNNDSLKKVTTSPPTVIDKPATKTTTADKTEKPTPPKASAVVADPKTEPEKDKEPFDSDLWEKVLDTIRVKYNTLYAIIRIAVPEIYEDRVVLKTKFNFHKKRLEDAKSQTIIIDIIKDLTGQVVIIECVIDEDIKTEEVVDGQELSPSISAITNIFGEAEVVE